MFVKTFIGLIMLALAGAALASPPAVGIAGNAKSCAACHSAVGPWVDGPGLIFDLLDNATGQSLKQEDGSFLVACAPEQAVTVLAVLGYRKDAGPLMPHRNGWLLVDTTTIGGGALSVFAPGWELNIPYGCRITGDAVPAYAGQIVSAAPLTIRPTVNAKDATVSLQALLTSGDAVKGKANEGVTQNYHERTVHLQIKP